MPSKKFKIKLILTIILFIITICLVGYFINDQILLTRRVNDLTSDINRVNQSNINNTNTNNNTSSTVNN